MRSAAFISEPVARVLSRVKGARPARGGWRARCPAHDGKSDTSLSIAQGEDGRVVFHCFAGCTHRAIASALGLEARELFAGGLDAPAPQAPRQPARLFDTARAAVKAYRATLGPEACRWTYRDATGDPVGLVLRWDREGGKTIRPVWRIGGGWQQSYPADRPLYGLDRLNAEPDRRVFVVEGEKCAEAVAALGLLTTTSPAGAQSADRADWSPLAGREVVVLPDSDDPGRAYAEAVRARILALPQPGCVVIAPLPGLAAGEDAVEFIERVHGGDAERARTAIEEAASSALARPDARGPIVTLSELLDDPRLLAPPETIASGWAPFDRAQPFDAVERGAVLVLAAPPGCYKTATMLRMARGFAEGGHAVAWLAGEMQPRTLVRRMLCQRARLAPAALLSGAMPPDHAARLNAAREWLETIRTRLTFTRAPIGFDSIERAAEGAAVVFLDYLQLIRHPEPEVRGPERIEDAMSRIAEVAQRTGAVFVVASAQGREGGTDRRDIRNATRGSSAIEYTADALYCAEEPTRSPQGFVVEFRCLKQREGERFPIEVPIDGATGAIAEGDE